MELLLRAIQQAILEENYLYAEQLIQQQIALQPVNDHVGFSNFSLIERTQDAQQLYNRASFSLVQENYEQAFYLFRTVLALILNSAHHADIQRIVHPVLAPLTNHSNLQCRSKRGRSNNDDDMLVAKNYLRDYFREESPEPMPPGPQGSPS